MSRIATDWAWKLNIKPASLKLILLSMADRADEEHCCFPSIVRLVRDTGLDRKTVQAGISSLSDMNVISDTGERKGRTKRVRVFRLSIEEVISPKLGSFQHEIAPKSGSFKEEQTVPKSGSLENEMIPKTEPLEQQTNPKTGRLNDPKNGTQNQSLITNKNKNNKPRQSGEAFEEFWRAIVEQYKRVGSEPGTKAEARKEFEKKNPTPEEVTEWISAVTHQAQNKIALQKSGQFAKSFKNVCRWIKHECWDDEVVSAGQSDYGDIDPELAEMIRNSI